MEAEVLVWKTADGGFVDQKTKARPWPPRAGYLGAMEKTKLVLNVITSLYLLLLLKRMGDG